MSQTWPFGVFPTRSHITGSLDRDVSETKSMRTVLRILVDIFGQEILLLGP